MCFELGVWRRNTSVDSVPAIAGFVVMEVKQCLAINLFHVSRSTHVFRVNSMPAIAGFVVTDVKQCLVMNLFHSDLDILSPGTLTGDKLKTIQGSAASSPRRRSYLRLIDFVYHSTLGLRVTKKRRRMTRPTPTGQHEASTSLRASMICSRFAVEGRERVLH